MIAHELYHKDDLWNRLQEPARPGKLPAVYLLLLAALDTGWKILEPIHLSDTWEADGKPVYHIFLHRSPAPQIRMLTIPAIPEVEGFLAREGLNITKEDLSFCAGMTFFLS